MLWTQGRTCQAVDSDGNPIQATAFCAFAFHDEIIANGTRVIMVQLDETGTSMVKWPNAFILFPFFIVVIVEKMIYFLVILNQKKKGAG